MSSSVVISPELKAQYGSSFSDDELRAFTVEKTNLFRGTMAVSIIYGVFALLLLLIALFYAPGRQLLGGDLFPFVVTFVAGVFVTVAILIAKIVLFKPKNFEATTYSKDLCPDYWTLKPSSPTDYKDADQNQFASMLKYKCVPNTAVLAYNQKVLPNGSYSVVNNGEPNVFGHTVKTVNNVNRYVKSNTDTRGVNNDLQQKLNDVQPSTIAGPQEIQCDTIFPNYMASVDNGGNTLRCAYATQCGIPWTAAGCPSS